MVRNKRNRPGTREVRPGDSPGGKAPGSGRKAAWAAVLLLLAVTFIVYAPAIHYGFVSMDDPFFTAGRMASGLTLDNVTWAFSETYAGFYYPLTLISHMLDRELFQGWAGGHHLMSLLIHLANVLLLLMLLHRATRSAWPSFLVAAMFALHPLHVESVAWVAERKDLLSTFFELLAFHAYVRYTERRSIGRYLAVFIGFVFALLSKSMVVTFPFLLLLLDYWPLGRLDFTRVPGNGARGFLKTLGRLLWEKIPLFALIPVSGWLTFIAQAKEQALSSGDRLPLDQRFANAILSYGRYILDMFVPHGLVAYVPHPQERYSLPLVILSALFLAACTLAAFLLGRRFRYLPVGWFWYLGSLLPVIGLVQAGLQASADRYTYMPLVGLFIILSWGAGDALRISPTSMPVRAWGPAIVLLLVLAALARMQVTTWSGNEVLFRRILTYYPQCPFALVNLANEYMARERWEEAAHYFEEASTWTRLLPGYQVNWGIALVKLKRYDTAVDHLQKVLSETDSGEAYYLLGFSLSQLQRHAEAIPNYRKAYGKPPVLSKSIVWIGDVYQKGGLCDEAIQVYRIIPPTDPEYPSASAGIAACGGKP